MNIYITGLNYSINDADLNDLFADYGEITSAKVIMDRETGIQLILLALIKIRVMHTK